MIIELAIAFIVLAIIAGVLGFRFLAGMAVWLAMILVVIFIILFFVSLVL